MNRVLTNFSASPIHFEVSVAAVMLKNLQLDSFATAFASRVFPLPGGPNNKRPFDGALNPVNNYTVISIYNYQMC